EVKRRSADGSVGSPHVRVGNCQASNKAESPVERLGFFAFVSSGENAGMPPRWRCAYRGYTIRSPDKVRSTASGGGSCPRVSSCDVNLSLLQPAAHVSNSITDTVAPDRPFQTALSP
ncbi:hypothetical protein CI612_14345, partial [Klebsiella quasipneumoniae subsp. similipneumoniae]